MRKGLSQSDIARQVGKHGSTISRELRRNALTFTAQDRWFYFRNERFWSEDDLGVRRRDDEERGLE